jgi:hypothetical protein
LRLVVCAQRLDTPSELLILSAELSHRRRVTKPCHFTSKEFNLCVQHLVLVLQHMLAELGHSVGSLDLLVHHFF